MSEGNVARVSQVLSEMEELGKAIEELKVIPQEFGKRLASVLRNEPIGEVEKGTEADRTLCTLAEDIRKARRAVLQEGRAFRDILGRLEV